MAEVLPPPLADMTSDEVVRRLDLAPHPEGGYYRETFRDTATLPGTSRALSTAIYFLLPAGVVSRWHKVDAAEIWHWYAGAPLRLAIAPADGGRTEEVVIAGIFQDGAQPQRIVPKGYWQQAESLGAWTLVGCTVAPGFEFAGFEMAAEGWSPKT